jgi:HK97 gp10 family phage protein
VTTYRVNGIDSIRSTILALPKAIARRSLDKACMRAALVVRDHARRIAPKDSGLMASDIVSAKDRRPELDQMDARAVVFVKWKGRRGAPYWRHVEFGTSKMAPQPFMRPAFEVNAMRGVQVIIETVANDLQAAIRDAGGIG